MTSVTVMFVLNTLLAIKLVMILKIKFSFAIYFVTVHNTLDALYKNFSTRHKYKSLGL